MNRWFICEYDPAVRIRGMILASFILVGMFLAGGVARADTPDPKISNEIQQCMAGHATDPFPPSCTFDGNGKLIGRNSGARAAGGGFLVFAGIALLWAAIPIAIAISVASRRKQSIGIAVLLTLALGWIGLLLFVFVMRPDVEPLARETLARAAAPYAPVSPVKRDGADPAARLRSLEDLHTQGLITDAEYTQRRTSILAEI